MQGMLEIWDGVTPGEEWWSDSRCAVWEELTGVGGWLHVGSEEGEWSWLTGLRCHLIGWRWLRKEVFGGTSKVLHILKLKCYEMFKETLRRYLDIWVRNSEERSRQEIEIWGLFTYIGWMDEICWWENMKWEEQEDLFQSLVLGFFPYLFRYYFQMCIRGSSHCRIFVQPRFGNIVSPIRLWAHANGQAVLPLLCTPFSYPGAWPVRQQGLSTSSAGDDQVKILYWILCRLLGSWAQQGSLPWPITA